VLPAPESVAAQFAGSNPRNTFAALQFQIHQDLRVQHPEWIEPNGDCLACDFYETRLAELLEAYARSGSDEVAADVHRALENQAIFNSRPQV
jgi:hypothetical protein